MYDKTLDDLESGYYDYGYRNLSETTLDRLRKLKCNLDRSSRTRTLSGLKLTEYNLYSKLLKNRYDITDVVTFLNRAEMRIISRDRVLKHDLDLVSAGSNRISLGYVIPYADHTCSELDKNIYDK